MDTEYKTLSQNSATPSLASGVNVINAKHRVRLWIIISIIASVFLIVCGTVFVVVKALIREYLPPPKFSYSGNQSASVDEAIDVLEWMMNGKLAERPAALFIMSTGRLTGMPKDYVGYAKVAVSREEFERLSKHGDWQRLMKPDVDADRLYDWNGSYVITAPKWWNANDENDRGCPVFYRSCSYAGLEYMKWARGYLYWFAEVDVWK